MKKINEDVIIDINELIDISLDISNSKIDNI